MKKVIQAEKEIRKQKFESAVIFDKEGNFLTWEDGEKFKVDLSKFEGKMENNILTHNHPTSYAASFSPQDVRYFLVNKLSEIRAVDGKYTYSLKLKKQLKDGDIEKIENKYKEAFKILNEELKNSIINDTECFEDIEHEAWNIVFKGSRIAKYTRLEK